MWVLRRVDRKGDGMRMVFVSKPGSASSYTLFLQDAQTFSTREQALNQACPESEVPFLVEDIFSGRNNRRSN